MTAPTYVLVDGENIDATLGLSVLGRRPNPEERPRWDRILSYAANLHEGSEARGLFFLNASSGQMPMNFVQALVAMGYRPVPLSGTSDQKVVDIGIQRTLDAIADRGHGRVLLASHDGDYYEQVSRLLKQGSEVGVLCFREYLNSSLAEMQSRGLTVHDLESDIDAFTVPLPRIRIIPLDAFDPAAFL